MARNYYAVYRSYGYLSMFDGGCYGIIHVFKDKKSRDLWIDDENSKSWPNINAGILSAETRYKIIPRRAWENSYTLNRMIHNERIIIHD